MAGWCRRVRVDRVDPYGWELMVGPEPIAINGAMGPL